MLKTLARFFGLDSPPPPPPKRRPTARRAKIAEAAPETEKPPIAHKTSLIDEPLQDRPRMQLGLPSFGIAVRTVVRGFGRHGRIPNASQLALARRRLGADYVGYLTALNLIDGGLTRFLLTEERIKDPAAIHGLIERMEATVYADLNTWSDAERIDLALRREAKFGGRAVPDALHVPQRVRDALLKRMNDAAAALLAKGGGAGGKSGGPAPALPEMSIEGGGELGEATVSKPSKTPSAGKKANEDDEPTPPLVEETPPRLEGTGPLDGEPEGGGPNLPRIF